MFFSNRMSKPLFALAIATGFSTVAAAEELTFGRAVSVLPSNHVMHSIEIRDVADDERMFVQLRGPDLTSPVTSDDEGFALSWYKISNPPDRSPTGHTISIGDETLEVTVGAPAYVMMPAQVVADGAPDPIADSVGYFKAFELDEASRSRLQIKLPSVSGVAGIDRAMPTHLAVPASYWHHDDHTPAADRSTALLLCQSAGLGATAARDEKDRTILDTFGINKLTITAGGPIVIPVTLR